ncbi:MAG: GntR family transcriptional regulator [Phycisphaerae bacterium]|nr:GntR family transcriptional regulator [Phycisphaerae bacterium]
MNKLPELPTVDHSNPMPKYLQTQRILIDAIRDGRFDRGAKLPSTKNVGTLVNVSLITAHRALEGLVEMGWVRREVGRGTFVRDDLDISSGTERTLFIGLLHDREALMNIGDYYHSTIINALRQAARRDTRRAEFFFRDGFDMHDKERKDVGAICMHPPLESQERVEHLAARHAVVVLGGSFPETSLLTVDCDNESGGRGAIRHLHELGHRRIMVVSGPMNLSNARDRAKGAAAEMARFGIDPDPRDMPVSRDSVVLDNDAKTRIERRLTAADRPTAIFAGGFYLALAVMQIARSAGLNIPRDLSVVGYDDPPSAPLLDPPLTTIRQPLNEMGARAYDLVRTAVIEKSATLSCWRLPCELIVRGSTAPTPD